MLATSCSVTQISRSYLFPHFIFRMSISCQIAVFVLTVKIIQSHLLKNTYRKSPLISETAQISLSKKKNNQNCNAFSDIEKFSHFRNSFISFAPKLSVDLFRLLKLKFHYYCFIMGKVLPSLLTVLQWV